MQFYSDNYLLYNVHYMHTGYQLCIISGHPCNCKWSENIIFLMYFFQVKCSVNITNTKVPLYLLGKMSSFKKHFQMTVYYLKF